MTLINHISIRTNKNHQTCEVVLREEVLHSVEDMALVALKRRRSGFGGFLADEFGNGGVHHIGDDIAEIPSFIRIEV